MFQFFHTHLKKIYIVLLILIIPSFCFYFIGGTSAKPKTLGTVLGKKVDEVDFYNAYQAVYFDAAMRYGAYFKQIAPYLSLEKEAWNRLLLLEKAKEYKIEVDDSELQNEIVKIFSGEGKPFDAKAYEKFVVQNLNMPIITFEDMIRDSLKTRKLREEILTEVAITDSEVEDYYKEENNRIEFSYLKVESKNYEKDVNVTEDVLKEFFEKEKMRFKIPEKIQLRYVFSKIEDFNDKISLTESECQEYYEENKEDYLIPDEKEKENSGTGEANTDDLKDEEKQDEPEKQYKPFEEVKDNIKKDLMAKKVREKAERFYDEVYRKMIEKNNFEEVTKEYGLKISETGHFDAMTPPEEIGAAFAPQVKDAFELPVNDFCGPYEHNGGWLIINVFDKQPARVPEELKEVREKVETEYRKENAPALTKTAAEEIRQRIMALMEKKTFEEAAKEIGQKTFVSGLISIKTKNIQGLGYHPDLVKEVFTLKESEISNSIEINKGNEYIIGQICKRQEPDMGSFQNQKDQYHKKALTDKQNLYYSNWLESLQNEINLNIKFPLQQN